MNKYKVGIISNILSVKEFNNEHGYGLYVEFTDGYEVSNTIVWNETRKSKVNDYLIGRNFLSV